MAGNGDKSWVARELAASGASLSEIDAELARAEAATKALAVKKVTWAQVSRVTDPGRYMFKFGWVTITAEDLAIWEQYPNAAFARGIGDGCRRKNWRGISSRDFRDTDRLQRAAE
jgi:hypothetical protein